MKHGRRLSKKSYWRPASQPKPSIRRSRPPWIGWPVRQLTTKQQGTGMPDREPPLRLAVVGHTNTGKTSLLRTLTRNPSFGQVNDSTGTKRHVEGARLLGDGAAAVEPYGTTKARAYWKGMGSTVSNRWAP